jgi:hypothetical protein
MHPHDEPRMPAGVRRIALAMLAGAAVFVWMLNLPACSMHQSGASSASQSTLTTESSSEPTSTPSPTPGASVDISYTHGGDYLVSFSVLKYSGTRLLETHDADSKRNTSIVIFEGGVPIWQFAADRGLLGHLGFVKTFAVKKVVYGELPQGFVESTPPSGPPEPLEVGHYYIFSVTRNSGVTNHEAIKVLDDGSLEGYTAEPLAGSSFELCCNLNSDFISPTEPAQ